MLFVYLCESFLVEKSTDRLLREVDVLKAVSVSYLSLLILEQIWPNGYSLSASSETDYVFPCNQCVGVQDTAGITRGKNSPFVSYPNPISFENRKCIIYNLIEYEIHCVLCPLYRLTIEKTLHS